MPNRGSLLGSGESVPLHPACRCCGSSRTTLVGSIAPGATFAGRLLPEPIPGGSLWACADCDLKFRYPVLHEDALDTLYRTGSVENWQDGVANRIDWLLSSGFLHSQPSVKSVLDVGCFDGQFLASLGDRYEKLCIEIHPEAVHRAKARGVRLVAHDLATLTSSDVKADAVTAIDVIEHTLNPLDFLVAMRNAAAPGGFLLIATGNTNAWSWRLMGSRYWYCAIGEHLSFISPAWCRYAAGRLGLEVVEIKRFSHIGPNVSAWIRTKEIAKNLIYRVSPYLSATIRRLRARGDASQCSKEFLFTPPDWMSANDHIFVALKRLH